MSDIQVTQSSGSSVRHPSAGRILLTGTALLLTVGMAIGIFTTSVFQSYVEQQLSSRLQGVAVNRSDAIESILDNAIAMAVLVNSSGGINRNLSALRRGMEPGTLANLQQDAEVLIQHGYRSVRLHGPDGALLVADGKQIDSPHMEIGLIAPIDAALIWKNGFVLRTTEKLHDAAHRYIGSVELERHLDDLTRIYLKKQPIGSTYDSFTCGKDANNEVTCFPSLLTRQLLLLAPFSQRSKLPVDYALEGHSGIRDAVDYRGQPVLAAFGPVGTYGLATVAKIDEQDLLAPTKDLVEKIAFSIAGLLLLGAVILNARIRPLVGQLTNAEEEARSATELALEREAKIQAVVAHANDGILTMGEDGVIRSINDAGAGIFGHSASLLVGQHFTVLLPERFREEGHRFFAQYKTIEADAPAKRQLNLITGLHSSGKELYFELGTNQIKWQGENLFIGLIHDVTESRRMQHALRENEKRLQTITDNLPALIAYVNKDKRYEFANNTYEQWFGKPLDQIIGQTVGDLLGDQYYKVEPAIEKVLRGEAVSFDIRTQLPFREGFGTVSYLPDKRPDGTIDGFYVLVVDTTAQKIVEQKLEKEHELLQVILSTIDVGVVACDAQGALTLFNRATKEFHGLPQHDLPTEQWSPFYSLYRSDGITPLPLNEIPLYRALKGEKVQNAEMCILSSTGRLRRIAAYGERLTNSEGALLGAVVAMNDVTEIKGIEERLRNMARHDTLTGLPNRSYFNEKLHEAIMRCARHEKCMALMFLDIDFFKSVNDTHGHHAGDMLLKTFARRLTQAVRKTDTVARLAGDEFVIILEDLHDPDEAMLVADKILETMKANADVGGTQVSISASIGIAVNLQGRVDGEVLLRRADEALYAAKAAGRRCYRVDVCVE